MSQTSLACKMRPESLSDLIGQSHLAGPQGVLTKMVRQRHPMSMILAGPPGCGKTTIASCLAHDLDIPCRMFNASTGNKKQMDQLVAEAKMSDGLYVIIDEIHRLNKDKQDFFLPHVESGLLTIVGCTTSNPYHAINPAIRSRCSIFTLKPLTEEDLQTALAKALTSDKGLNDAYTANDDALKAIAALSAGDVRFAYNTLEMCTLLCEDNHITVDTVKQAVNRPNIRYDRSEDNYYDTLSGLQKSIRGSDVDASLYYFAKLCDTDDMVSLERRLLVIAYEEVGLANPNAPMRTWCALQAAKTVGMPEARIIIGQVIIDLALSPKSHSVENAVDKAREALNTHPADAPEYLRLTPVNLAEEDKYDYGRPDLWEYIQYLPDVHAGAQFYVPWTTSAYERQLTDNYKRIRAHGRTNNLRELKTKHPK